MLCDRHTTQISAQWTYQNLSAQQVCVAVGEPAAPPGILALRSGTNCQVMSSALQAPKAGADQQQRTLLAAGRPGLPINANTGPAEPAGNSSASRPGPAEPAGNSSMSRPSHSEPGGKSSASRPGHTEPAGSISALDDAHAGRVGNKSVSRPHAEMSQQAAQAAQHVAQVPTGRKEQSQTEKPATISRAQDAGQSPVQQRPSPGAPAGISSSASRHVTASAAGDSMQADPSQAGMHQTANKSAAAAKAVGSSSAAAVPHASVRQSGTADSTPAITPPASTPPKQAPAVPRKSGKRKWDDQGPSGPPAQATAAAHPPQPQATTTAPEVAAKSAFVLQPANVPKTMPQAADTAQPHKKSSAPYGVASSAPVPKRAADQGAQHQPGAPALHQQPQQTAPTSQAVAATSAPVSNPGAVHQAQLQNHANATAALAGGAATAASQAAMAAARGDVASKHAKPGQVVQELQAALQVSLYPHAAMRVT